MAFLSVADVFTQLRASSGTSLPSAVCDLIGEFYDDLYEELPWGLPAVPVVPLLLQLRTPSGGRRLPQYVAEMVAGFGKYQQPFETLQRPGMDDCTQEELVYVLFLYYKTGVGHFGPVIYPGEALARQVDVAKDVAEVGIQLLKKIGLDDKERLHAVFKPAANRDRVEKLLNSMYFRLAAWARYQDQDNTPGLGAWLADLGMLRFILSAP
jgi:hypothetical protein